MFLEYVLCTFFYLICDVVSGGRISRVPYCGVINDVFHLKMLSTMKTIKMLWPWNLR